MHEHTQRPLDLSYHQKIYHRVTSLIHHLNTLVNTMYQDNEGSAGRSQTSVSRPRWIDIEVDALVAYMYDRRLDLQGGGSLKDTMLTGAATEIHSKCGGILKKSSTVKNKWTSVSRASILFSKLIQSTTAQKYTLSDLFLS